jgi:UDPglucose--hexose-1-phosphate uridylyltransferase
MRDRLKFLAGSEIGAGVFTADTLPEEKAAELRAVVIDPLDADG